MLTLTGVLCGVCGCAVRAVRGKTAGTAEGPGQPESDDLTAIRGIGIASQNRLYTAGIKTFAQLARATPEELRRILGEIARGAKVEDWIREAGERAAPSAAPE